MSGLKIYYQIKLTLLALILTIAFQSPCWAFVFQKVYKISGGDMPKISSEIQFHIYEKDHKLAIKCPKKGFYYFYPCMWGTCYEDNYVITSVKEINNEIYLYTKNSLGGSGYKKHLLNHLKKNGLKYKKIKDENLIEELAKYSDDIMNSYKLAEFYSEDSSQNNKKPVKTLVAETKPTPNLATNTIPVKQNYKMPETSGREISKSGVVYNNVKDGVVTIVLGIGHGSGFLVDERGLILTNYHVVKTVEDEELRIRFGQNQIVTGKIVAKDPRNDVAVIWVNLQNIKNYKVLKLAYPKTGESLVLMGEKVLAIGSPLVWEAMEKSLTQGVVSKCDKSVIYHDANIDGGNSGGPLLNFGGYVVGINTFNYDESKGMSGSVPITRAYNILNEATKKISTLAMPSSELMPDVGQIPYTLEVLENAYYNSDKKTKKRDEPYIIEAGDFDIYISTPAIGYRELANKDKKVMKRFIKRQEKQGDEVTEEEYESKDLAYYYDQKPVVKIHVVPKPQLSPLSAGLTLLEVSAKITLDVIFGIMPPIPSYWNYTFDKDFKKLELLNKKTGESLIPYTSGKALISHEDSELYGINYAKIADKTYYGVYEFDPEYFDTNDKLEFDIYYSNEEPPITEKIDDKIKNYIIEDFKPYWDYICNQKL